MTGSVYRSAAGVVGLVAVTGWVGSGAHAAGRGVESEPNDAPGTDAVVLGNSFAASIGIPDDVDLFRLDDDVGLDQGELEPNDSMATANLIAEGVITGAVDPRTDVDYFGIDLPADATIVLVMDNEFTDVFELLSPGGQTIASSYRVDVTEPRPFVLRATVASAGRYYARVRQYYAGVANPPTGPSPGRVYDLTVSVAQSGPGDPTTRRLSGANSTSTIVAGENGELLVLDGFDGDIIRIPWGGAPEIIGRVGADDMVLDGFGDLLLAQYGAECGGCIIRYSIDTRERTRFGTSTGEFRAITVGPDGDVWAYRAPATITRFDPYGVVLRQYSTGAAGPVTGMAFSPAGVLHFTNGEALWTLSEAGGLAEVHHHGSLVWGVTFDAEGGIYLSTTRSGLLKLDATYALIEDPFAAEGLVPSLHSAFMRDPSGAMTSRLVASGPSIPGPNGPFDGTIVEVNPAGVTAPGARIGVDLQPMTVQSAVDHLLTGTGLNEAEQRALDEIGNDNGAVDVGDVRALLEDAGSLTPTTQRDPGGRP